MIYVENDVINLTRGDDATLTVPLTTGADETYEMGEDEYLIFGVRQAPTENAEVVLEVSSPPGENAIHLSHSDTSQLPVGFYSAEIQLMTSDGKRVTVWPKLTGSRRVSHSNRRNFCLMTEVIRA